MKYQCKEVSIMIGMIRRYLIGRTRIIAKRQLAQGAKKAVKSVKDKKLLTTKAKSQILAFIISISLIVPHSTFATGIVHDPQSFAQSYAQFVESIEKYNNMIKTAQDTLDTMNRINDVMNTANNTLNNLQTGLADPRQLWDRFQSNVENIKANYEHIQKSLQNRNWSEIMFKKEFATCKKKWQNLMKEVKEYEEQKAKDNLDLAERGDDGSDSAGKFLEDAQQKYADMQETKEIQAELKMIEDAYNGGLSKGTKEINAFFDQMQYQVDIFNIEAKARQHKNPYERQRDICNEIDIKQIEFEEQKAKNEYFKAMAEGRYADAKREFQIWKKKGFEKEIKRQKVTKEVIGQNKSFFNANDKQAALSINQDTGELTPAKCDDANPTICWGKKGFPNKESAAELLSIPQTDDKGNTTTIKKWVAKQSTIHTLFEMGDFNESLSLQNQRNMVIALQGDTQAIQKSQLETFTMLGMQIRELHNSVNAIGNIAAHFLQMQVDEKDDMLKHSGDIKESKETPYHTFKAERDYTEKYINNIDSLGFGKFDDILEEDTESGRIKFKTTNKDVSGIIGD